MAAFPSLVGVLLAVCVPMFYRTASAKSLPASSSPLTNFTSNDTAIVFEQRPTSSPTSQMDPLPTQTCNYDLRCSIRRRRVALKACGKNGQPQQTDVDMASMGTCCNPSKVSKKRVGSVTMRCGLDRLWRPSGTCRLFLSDNFSDSAPISFFSHDTKTFQENDLLCRPNVKSSPSRRCWSCESHGFVSRQIAEDQVPNLDQDEQEETEEGKAKDLQEPPRCVLGGYSRTWILPNKSCMCLELQSQKKKTKKDKGRKSSSRPKVRCFQCSDGELIRKRQAESALFPDAHACGFMKYLLE